LATALDPGHAEVSNGELFGDYKIICEIGQGGMGIVYLAEQRRAMRREVALKVLKPGLDSAAVVRRFETERKALAMMEHPGIATLYDAGVSSLGRPYFVMEFVDGAPITAACDSRRASIPERLALIVEVCRAIDHAHRKGVVHRDIKPSNVLVTERDGRPSAKVIDFGVARAVSGSLTGNTLETVFGELLGTPEYMSPEQAGFETSKVGPASDTYSLGVLLYELTAGVLPFDPVKLRESGIAEAARKIREDDTPPPATRLRDNGLIDEIAGRRNI
jgi:serine/threonine protein kinase